MNNNYNEFKQFSEYKNRKLAVFFTIGISLKRWHELGIINREIAIYNELSKYFKHIYFFTYGDESDLLLNPLLKENISIIPKKHISNPFLYSLFFPIIHSKLLKQIDYIKTNQIMGAWSAIISKYLNKNIIIVRSGYLPSLAYKDKKFKRKILDFIEYISFKKADGIITSSKFNFNYINKKFKPKGIHFFIPNFVETNLFKPLNLPKKNSSICFIGRLSPEKNLFSLINAINETLFNLTIIGSGILEKELKDFSNENENIKFLGSLPNHELPKILNEHEIFILPSLWENMPKSLLEAMSCGIPVIATDVRGNNEVIINGENGILCNSTSNSIKKAINKLIKDEKLKEQLGKNARETILNNFSLTILIEKELNFMKEL